MKTRDDWIGELFGLIAVLPAVCSMGFGALVFIRHCISWLATAEWPKETILDGLNHVAGNPVSLDTGWRGFDKLVSSDVALPVEVGLIFILPRDMGRRVGSSLQLHSAEAVSSRYIHIDIMRPRTCRNWCWCFFFVLGRPRFFSEFFLAHRGLGTRMIERTPGPRVEGPPA